MASVKSMTRHADLLPPRLLIDVYSSADHGLSTNNAGEPRRVEFTCVWSLPRGGTSDNKAPGGNDL